MKAIQLLFLKIILIENVYFLLTLFLCWKGKDLVQTDTYSDSNALSKWLPGTILFFKLSQFKMFIFKPLFWCWKSKGLNADKFYFWNFSQLILLFLPLFWRGKSKGWKQTDMYSYTLHENVSLDMSKLFWDAKTIVGPL